MASDDAVFLRVKGIMSDGMYCGGFQLSEERIDSFCIGRIVSNVLESRRLRVSQFRCTGVDLIGQLR